MAEQQYPCEGYKNVFVILDETRFKPGMTFWVHKYTQTLIDVLIKKRPNWVFKARRLHSYEGQAITAASFDVWENGEMLGDISTSTTTRTGETKIDYCYDTERLQEGRQRGGWTRTTKLDLAVKNILKAFYQKTITERVMEAHSYVRSRLNANAVREGHSCAVMARQVNAAITNFVIDNWEDLAPRMREAGIDLDDRMPDMFREWRKIEAVEEAYSKGKGYVIVLRGSDYALSQFGDVTKNMRIKASEDLPDIVRRNLGLLKLSAPGVTVPDIGLRISDYIYYVMDGVNND